MLHHRPRPSALRHLSIAFIASVGATACAARDSVPVVVTAPEAVTASAPQRAPRDVAPVIDTSHPILALAGTIVMREPDGTERGDLDGTLRINLTSPNGGGSADIEIVAGRWQLDLFLDSDGDLATATGQRGLGCEGRAMEYHVSPARIDGEEFGVHHVREPYRSLKFGDRNAELFVRRPTPVELAVRDATTGEHLDGVCVGAWDHAQPLGEMEFHQFATTLELVTRDTRSPFSFTPTQWGLLEIPQTYCVTSPGYVSRTVDLDLYSGGSRPVLLQRSTTQQTPPNQQLAASAPRAQNRSEGTPRAAESAGVRAIEKALARMRTRAAKRADTRAPAVPPAPREERHVDISVLALDNSTNEPTEIRTLFWSTFMEDEQRRGVAKREADDTHFRFSVPEGPVRFTFCGLYFQRLEKVIASEGAEFVFRIDVNDAAAASIRLADGEATVPWPRFDQDVVERLDRGEAHGTMVSLLSAFQIGGARPGRYRIRIPEINGYEPHPPVEFDLIAGETSEIVVDLIRSP